MYGGLWLRLGLFGPFGSLWALHPQSNSWGRLLKNHVWSHLHLWINEQTCQNHPWNHLWKSLSTPKIPNHHPPKQQNFHFISSSKAHHSVCRRHQFHADDQNKPSAQWVSFLEQLNYCWTTVDGRNPAPVDMVKIPSFTRFYTSQVVQDFFHQQY